MNIALIGMPSSGKTELAQKLAVELRKKGTVSVVDGYVPRLSEDRQLALGPLADYLGNLYIALTRWSEERLARMEDDSVITCGTFLETAVYMATHFVGLQTILSEQEKVEAGPKIDAVLRILAILYTDIVDYDYAFYLPPTKGDEETKFMDQQLQAGVEAFKVIEVTPLLDRATAVKDVLEVLNAQPA